MCVGPLLCPGMMLDTLISFFNIYSHLRSRYYFCFCLTGVDVDVQREISKDSEVQSGTEVKPRTEF